jgi:ubiquitin fusion degradation protein 1
MIDIVMHWIEYSTILDRLEKALRNFSTLTAGDMVQINYNSKVYQIQVLEVKPHFEDHQGISIVETDLEVDFAPPVGYVEPSSQKPAQSMVITQTISIH